MVYRLLVSVMLFFELVQVPCVPAAAQDIARPLSFSALQFKIEDLTAEVHSDGRILVISGKIKNIGFSNIRGYVTVYLKGINHNVIKTVDIELTDKMPISNGQYGTFQTTTNIESIPGIANVSVEFTETGQVIY